MRFFRFNFTLCQYFRRNKDICEIYSTNFKYILVDEYQDTNFIQSKWLNILAKKSNNIVALGMMINPYIAGEVQK